MLIALLIAKCTSVRHDFTPFLPIFYHVGQGAAIGKKGDTLERVKIDTSQIPESVRMTMLDIIYPAVIEYFKQPGVEEKYQEWLREREAHAGSKSKT